MDMIGERDVVGTRQIVAESGALVDAVQAMSSRNLDGKTNMIHAVQLCLITAHRFADAAYRGYLKLSDPLEDKDTQIEI